MSPSGPDRRQSSPSPAQPTQPGNLLRAFLLTVGFAAGGQVTGTQAAENKLPIETTCADPAPVKERQLREESYVFIGQIDDMEDLVREKDLTNPAVRQSVLEMVISRLPDRLQRAYENNRKSFEDVSVIDPNKHLPLIFRQMFKGNDDGNQYPTDGKIVIHPLPRGSVSFSVRPVPDVPIRISQEQALTIAHDAIQQCGFKIVSEGKIETAYEKLNASQLMGQIPLPGSDALKVRPGAWPYHKIVVSADSVPVNEKNDGMPQLFTVIIDACTGSTAVIPQKIQH